MKSSIIKIIIFIIVAVPIMYLAFHGMKRQNLSESNIITPTPAAQILTTTAFNSPSLEQNSADGLKNAIEEALKGTKGTYGVIVKNLKTGESYYSNDHREFEPGSLYKLWIMAATFNQIQNGQLQEDEILTEDVQVLNELFHIDPEAAELTQGSITLRVKDALNLMITNSDNYAALLLSEKIKLPNVKAFLEENGFVESTLGEPPETTSYDIALFFEKLYMGELADKGNTQKMIDILKKQTLNDKLPKYLPKELPIAHKTGEIGYFTHDAGIVFAKNGNYIIVVLSESDFPSGAEGRIADISKAVYEYFEMR